MPAVAPVPGHHPHLHVRLLAQLDVVDQHAVRVQPAVAQQVDADRLLDHVLLHHLLDDADVAQDVIDLVEGGLKQVCPAALSTPLHVWPCPERADH